MDISVLVPFYNSERFVRRALECLRLQDENSIEFILINDGSSDDTLKNIEEYLNKNTDGRFIILNKKNTGYGDSLNAGLSISKGEYVGVYEPDDIIERDFFSELNNNKNDNDIIKYNGIYLIENEKKSRLFKYSKKEIDNYKLLRRRLLLSHPSIINGIYRRDFLDRNNIRYCRGKGASFQDEQFRISLLYCNPKIKIIDECKYFYVQHQEQSIKKAEKMVEHILFNWSEEYDWIKKHSYKEDIFIIETYRQMINLKKKGLSQLGMKKLKEGFRRYVRSSIIIFRCVIYMIKLKMNLKDIVRFIYIAKVSE